MARTTARVDGTTLLIASNDANPITVGTDAWFAWLETATAFVFTSPSGRFTARKERRARGTWYWKAYRTDHGILHRAYLGKSPDLTLDQLTRAAATLTNVSTAVTQPPDPPLANLLATKLFVPPARANLVPARACSSACRLACGDKLTLIAAPAGFGKTTLLSAWRATVAGSALPFAWVSLDRADNDPLRFWSYRPRRPGHRRPGVGTTALTLLQSPQPPPIERILTNVLNAFSASRCHRTGARRRSCPGGLPCDHGTGDSRLRWPGCSTICPPNLHLVIVTRADPRAAAGAPARTRCRDRAACGRSALHARRSRDLSQSGDGVGAHRRRSGRIGSAHRRLDRRAATGGAGDARSPRPPRLHPHL